MQHSSTVDLNICKSLYRLISLFLNLRNYVCLFYVCSITFTWKAVLIIFYALHTSLYAHFKSSVRFFVIRK